MDQVPIYTSMSMDSQLIEVRTDIVSHGQAAFFRFSLWWQKKGLVNYC